MEILWQVWIILTGFQSFQWIWFLILSRINLFPHKLFMQIYRFSLTTQRKKIHLINCLNSPDFWASSYFYHCGIQNQPIILSVKYVLCSCSNLMLRLRFSQSDSQYESGFHSPIPALQSICPDEVAELTPQTRCPPSAFPKLNLFEIFTSECEIPIYSSFTFVCQSL